MSDCNGINKPAKKHNPNLHIATVLWEEDINDSTGYAIGWLGLFTVEETGEFLVQYRDHVKRHSIDAPVRAKARTAMAIVSEKFTESEHLEDLTVEVEGMRFKAHRCLWECEEIFIDAHPNYAKPEQWIYDLTDNCIGRFIIAGWEAKQKEFAAFHQQTRQSAMDEHVT